MFTVSSNILRCTLDVAQEVAEEWANLRIESAPWPWCKEHGLQDRCMDHHLYWMWQDYATGGGGCRIVWKDGICWVSRHSGYAYADITADVIEILETLGAKPIVGKERWEWDHKNPNIYP